MAAGVSEEVLKQIYTHLQNNPNLTVQEFLRKARFESGMEIKCPRCGSTEAWKNGSNYGRNGEEFIRFKCKKCNRSFQASTESVFKRAQLPLRTIMQIASCMIRGLSVRATARECGVNKRTAFLWRHKFTECLKDNLDTSRHPVAVNEQGDNALFDISYKGNHTKRPGFTIPRFVMKEQDGERVAVQIIHHVGSGKRKSRREDQVCVTEMAGVFPFAQKGLALTLDYSDLKTWINTELHGVASKWLPNYMALYGFIQSYPDSQTAPSWLLSYAASSHLRLTVNSMTKRQAVPDQGRIEEPGADANK